jgi:uncharacterized protein YdaU (DUF1376 family)
MRNTKTPFKDFYTWFFKDWFVSGARSRLSVPARSIYQDLLGLCYTEGRIENDKAVLMSRLGVPEAYGEDMDAAIKEFDVDKKGRLTHPRVTVERKRLATKRKQLSHAGKTSAAKRYGNSEPQREARTDFPF